MDAQQSCVETPPATLQAVKYVLQKPAHGHDGAPEKEEESKYADLELGYVRTGGTGAGKDCRFDTRNPTSVLTDKSSAGAPCATAPNRDLAINREIETMNKDNSFTGKRTGDVVGGPLGPSPSSIHHLLHAKSEEEEEDKRARAMTQPGDSGNHKDQNKQEGEEELHCGDFYLSWRSDSDDVEGEGDDVSVVLSDDSVPCATEDESHYITTHEIQLCELSDHEEDCDPGVSSSTSWEDDNQVYTFVDYAALDRDGALGESSGDGGREGAATVSTLLESDLCDAAKISSSDESVSKIQQQQQQQSSGSSAGQIHLSITATSRAINDPCNVQEEGNILYHARRSGDMSRYVLRGVDAKAETLCDKAKCFIALPGRVHFGGKLRGKEVTGYSSGASSAVSELDDADKEVRNLTAKAFKSLAYPYLDAFGFSTSSESSASERGINKWSTFVDLKYGNMNVPHQALDQRVVSRQNSFEIAKNLENIGYKGIALASIKPPTSKLFTLRGDPHSASSSTKKIELMGKFSQGHSGVITLTETLNFRCNVNSGMPGGERRTDFAQNAAGSRSTDEVTDSFPSAQRREASKPPPKTMEGTHKKAIFASSLIKNVISKKMQFEQERKMERGEIREPLNAPSPCSVHHESDGGVHRGKGSRELHTQSSRLSESSSDYTIMCLDELGDIVDSGSCDTKSDSRRHDAPETNLEPPANEVGIDTKKGALDASKNTLLRSQNSAFRCWKDEELEFQKDRKNEQTQEEKPPSVDNKAGEGDQSSAESGKATKMSRLFVPSIQLLQSDGEAGEQLQSADDSARGCEGDAKLRSDNTLCVAGSRRTTSRSPEIKINLRSVRDNKAEPFSVSKLRAPNIGCNVVSLARTDELKSQTLAAALKGESSDKVPHFMVRDIRDNKAKLQTPIYQVRDVRKLVKSSYHFVSLDNNENKSTVASAESHQEQKKHIAHRNLNSVSPIVIKCQSVNTNSNVKQCDSFDLSKQETLEVDRSSPEGDKSIPLQWAAGRAAISNSSEGGVGSKTESRSGSKKLEKISDVTEQKPESKMANQVALEKLQAAVKTMEQLYVFDKNEWKRKNKPLRLTDSHVLPLLAGEDHGRPEEDGARAYIMDKIVRGDSYPSTDKMPPSKSSVGAAAAAAGALVSGENLPKRDDKDLLKDLPTSSSFDDRLFAKTVQTTGTTSGSKNMFSLSSSLKASTSTKVTQPNSVTQTPFSVKHFVPKSPKRPMSLKVSQPRYSRNEGAEVDRSSQDNENYLTIPLKSKTQACSSRQPAPADQTSMFTSITQLQPTTPPGYLGSGTRGLEDHSQTPKHSSIVMGTCTPEIPPATIYHSLPLGMSTNQPQMYCFSPAITPAPTIDPFQATQRKMLLDPTTGNYYLVDTPVQPASKRLFDPETGQYVDVPMPQPPMTPLPMPISPLALSPGAYGHTYMIYPGFMSTPSVIPARTLVQSQMSMHSEVEKASSQQTEGMCIESPFYMATGKSPHVASGAQQQASASRPVQGFNQPVISITSQQGPRIIAPPSFDGTTMSFVVEHR